MLRVPSVGGAEHGFLTLDALHRMIPEWLEIHHPPTPFPQHLFLNTFLETFVNSTNQQQSQYQTIIGAVTDVGQTRKHNEDYVGFFKPDDPGQLVAYGVLLVICDGVGGAAAGEIASETAVHRILNDYYEASAKMTVQERLASAIQSANAAIYALNEQRERQMATTVVAAVIIDKHLVVAHAGDSRAYLVRGGKISQITEDHSWVEEMVRSGDLTPAEAKVHPWRNRITRGLGMTPTVKVDVTIFDWQPEDILVLCSDGLTRHVQDAEIAKVVTSYPPENAAQRLIDMANQRGGKDNISAIVATTTEFSAPIPPPVPEEDAESREPTQVPAATESVNVPRNKLILLLGLLVVVLMCSFGGVIVLRPDKKTPTATLASSTMIATASSKEATLSTAVLETKEPKATLSSPTTTPSSTPIPTATPTPTLPPITPPITVQTADSTVVPTTSILVTSTISNVLTTTPTTWPASSKEIPAAKAQFVLNTMTSSDGPIAVLTLPCTKCAGDVAFDENGNLYLVAIPDEPVKGLDFVPLEKSKILSHGVEETTSPVTITLPYTDTAVLKQISFSSHGEVLGVLANGLPHSLGVRIGEAPRFHLDALKCKTETAQLTNFAFGPGGGRVACGGNMQGIVLDAVNKGRRWTPEKWNTKFVSNLVVSLRPTDRGDSFNVVAGLAEDGTEYYVYRTNNNKLWLLNLIHQAEASAQDSFSAIALDAHADYLAVGTQGDKETQVLWAKWNDDQTGFNSPSPLPDKGLQGTVTTLTFIRNDEVLAGGTDAGYVALWDMSTSQFLKKTWNVDARVEALAFSDDGLLAVLTPSRLLIYRIDALP